MSKNTNKVKKVPRFSALDVVIILLVIVAVVGIYFRYNIVDMITNAKDLKQYTVAYTIENVRSSTPDYLNVDDEVYFASNGEKLGTLIFASDNKVVVKSDYASETLRKPDGEIIEVFYPDMDTRVKATGSLNCEGRYSSEGRFLVNGSTHIAMGQYVDVKTEYVTVTIRIDNITLVSE